MISLCHSSLTLQVHKKIANSQGQDGRVMMGRFIWISGCIFLPFENGADCVIFFLIFAVIYLVICLFSGRF